MTSKGTSLVRFFMWNGERPPLVAIRARMGIGGHFSSLPMISLWAEKIMACPSGKASSLFFRGTSALPWLSSSQSSQFILSADLQPSTDVSIEFLELQTRMPHSGRW